ncbi:MAG: MBOAT family protein [Rhodospirillales bacterium]|nr:MBOAT family protein [Rhodospirillales bacterium]
MTSQPVTKARADLALSPKTIGLIAVLLVVAAGLVLGEYFTQRSTLIRTPAGVVPLTADMLPLALPPTAGDGLGVVLPNRGGTERMVLDLVLEGEAFATSPSVVPEVTHRNLALGPTSPYCRRSTSDQWLQCHVPLEKGAREDTVWLAAADPAVAARIAEISVRVVKATRATPLGTGTVTWVALALAVAIPILWVLHRRRALAEWVIVALAAGIIAALQPGFTLALFVFLAALFLVGRRMQAITDRRGGLLVSAFLATVAFLAAFKYGPLAIRDIFPDIGGLNLLLPLGISYFVVRLIDTQFRFYRAELAAVTFREYLVYMVFPPTIPAGPLDTLPGFHERRLERIGRDDIAYGLARIGIGILKKILIVDSVLGRWLYHPLHGAFWHATLDPEFVSAIDVLRFSILALLIIYLDFSAYSDIAIGLGRLMGYRVPENFNWPILARNVRDYWRGWHMSMTDWCVRNVYFPLTVSTRNALVPLYATFMVVGLWHALDLTWFVWSLHHATGLAFLAWLGSRRRSKVAALSWLRRPLGIAATLLFVAWGHTLASLTDPWTAFTLYGKILQIPLLLLGLAP